MKAAHRVRAQRALAGRMHAMWTDLLLACEQQHGPASPCLAER
ncbi:MAG: hypothetical protein ACK54C_00855 [Betaproteobacteria bacterium]|jgi:hypothetical protein